MGCVPAGLDYVNREVRLHPLALDAWLAMKQAAAAHNVTIYICSAFRSYAYQAELIKRKLSAGHDIESIISILAPPGFSEHHTGRAIDIITDGLKGLDESLRILRLSVGCVIMRISLIFIYHIHEITHLELFMSRGIGVIKFRVLTPDYKSGHRALARR